MSPTLAEGEFVLMEKGKVPQAGDLGVFRHPEELDVHVVKRVVELNAHGSFVVRSDNPEQGSDSRTWGPLEASSMLGTVTLVLGRSEAEL